MTDELSRLDALETRVAHQDAIIEDLNTSVATQWRQIDALVRQLARLADRLQDISHRDSRQPEPPPPHY